MMKQPIAYLLDGKGGAKSLSWDTLEPLSDIGETVWVHMDYEPEQNQAWVRKSADLNELVSEALLAEETRPRCVVVDDGILVALRGVNMNPGANPEDMVSIRIWITKNRIISTHHRKLLAIDDLVDLFSKNMGPATSGEFLTTIAYLLIDRMESVVEKINDEVDDLQDRMLTAQSHELRSIIADLRRQIIGLRRYLSPQRETLIKLSSEKVSWLSDIDKMHAREVGDALTRYVEDLESARDRAAVTQEELVSRLSEHMEQRMYVLSVVAAIFLPLSFLTGLLGINVGGIPGADYKLAFLVVCVLMVIIAFLQYWIFKVKKWF